MRCPRRPTCPRRPGLTAGPTRLPASEYDLVLFGATGFAGGLTAKYLARHAPRDTRWALAGRNAGKLAAVRADLTAIDPAHNDLDLITVDASDGRALREVAARTQVIITTVGPYIWHGEPLVAACAAAGTDYVDLTGEPEFVDTMFLKHHEEAVASGARIVHAWVRLDTDRSRCALHDAAAGRRRAGAGPGVHPGQRDVLGWDVASAMAAMSRPGAMARAAKARRAAQPVPAGRRVGVLAGPPRHDQVAHAWIAPLPVIDNQIVLRSAAALPDYGPDFRYGHYAAVRRLPVALAGLAAMTALAVSAQVKPLRAAVGRFVKPGEGPD